MTYRNWTNEGRAYFGLGLGILGIFLTEGAGIISGFWHLDIVAWPMLVSAIGLCVSGAIIGFKNALKPD